MWFRVVRALLTPLPEISSLPRPPAGLQNAAINLAGAVAFAGLLTADLRGAVRRKEQRRRVVRAQIEFGDREVFVNEASGRTGAKPQPTAHSSRCQVPRHRSALLSSWCLETPPSLQDGDRMSRLKEVDDDWILRRLDRFGRRDGMPYVGPQACPLGAMGHWALKLMMLTRQTMSEMGCLSSSPPCTPA